ncbi:carbamoyltransferase family protein [Candidatus Pelagibacter sp.]|uniref:carbamoyltransferase family protein n=1 Tax=Candidatus Pelagibacter sp. TaxID=2024849 RepID=UPI003F83519D
MKYTLGLNFLHSDSSACIFENGLLIAAAEEERFTRIKHTTVFPYNSINFCLKKVNLDISKIDFITVNTNPLSAIWHKFFFISKNLQSLPVAFGSIKNSTKKLKIKDYIEKIDNENKFFGEIKFINHHESHIASSLFFNEFKECVNLSVDGFGDFASCAWGFSKNKKLNIDNKIYFPHSLGIFYQSMTQYLGFKNYGDEYKVMGLSSYGEPKYVDLISKLIIKKSEGFELNLDYFLHHKKQILSLNSKGQAIYSDLYSIKLIDLLGQERKKDEKITQRHMDLAKSTQVVYEEVFFSLLNNLYKKYKCKNLSLSGGCAMNSVANGKIINNSSFEKIYISPNPGDAGGAIGSACVHINKNLNKTIYVNNYAYLGPKYDNNDIKEFIEQNLPKKKYKINFFNDEEISDIISKNLTESKIIGWFQNETEWGPRALGNRSIIADARNPNIKEIINSKIKRRENFRPFAPSILYEKTKDWFEIENEVPFMSEVYPIKKDKLKLLPGITHVDGTGRLQTVKKINNLKYYNLINSFYKITGIPIILNTSFNENEPIVNTPQEAFDCFDRTDMDLLVIGNCVISR